MNKKEKNKKVKAGLKDAGEGSGASQLTPLLTAQLCVSAHEQRRLAQLLCCASSSSHSSLVALVQVPLIPLRE